MKVESCFQLGYVIRSHGIEGEVSIFLDTDNPERYTNLESVFVENGQKLIPFFIESILIRENQAIIKFEGIDDRDSSEQLKGQSLFLPLELLPALGEGEFYYHEVIGYEVVDEVAGSIGEIQSVYEANGNDLFSVLYNGKEVLIPIRDELIIKVDKKEGEIFVKLPDGLLEIYLKS